MGDTLSRDPRDALQAHRDRIPRARYKVANWAEQERGLVRCGDLRFWISEDALDAWIAPVRRRRGGQRRHPNLAIEAMLVLAAAFRLPLCQTEGFARCPIGLLGLALRVPDQSTLVRRRRMVTVEPHVSGRSGPADLVLDSTGRKVFGPGEWARKKHGEKRCSSREMHIAVDASTGEVLAHALTDEDTSDPAKTGELVASFA